MPRIIILAGPNGAGKTTFAREFLPNEAGVIQFVNADLIAAGLSPFDPASVDISAGRLMIERIDELFHQRADFAVETTLSGTWLLNKIPLWRESGYSVELFYVRLNDPSTAVERVKIRVSEGGHNIPEETIRRRFIRSLQLLPRYQQAVDVWTIYNNSRGDTTLEESGRN